MATWQQFLDDAGALGVMASARLAEYDMVILGTVRRDGSARVSMCEAYDVGDELLLGMMRNSTKALDLLHDPRLTVHTVVTDKTGVQGEVKLIGRAIEVTDPALRRAYADRLWDEQQFRPTEPYPLFAVHIERAWGIRYGIDGVADGREILQWG